MPKLSFFVAMKVVGKQRPRFSFKSQHAYTPRRTLDAEWTIKHSAEEAMRSAGLKTAFSTVPVSVMLTAYLPIAKSTTKRRRAAAARGEVPCLKKPDVDNILKLMDALNGVVFEDDKQVVSASVFKLYNNEVEGIHFSIEWPGPEAIDSWTRSTLTSI